MSARDIDTVGGHFILGLRPTPSLDPRDRALLQELKPAGVVLFKSNFRHDLPYEGWLASHLRLIEEVRAAIGRPNILIGVDHEGGRVCRTPAPITRYAAARRWASSAAAVGRAMGRELASLAINVSFAPVLDIHTNPANPVIGPRAFGSTPEDVTAAALPFMRALQGQGVIACGKHFPGHGDTSVDSHLGLPRQDRSLDELRARELKPFAAAIDAGAQMLMSSHILFPAVDPDHPVTLSRRFVTEVLREEMGFSGVVVSDDVGMGAMQAYFADPRAAAQLIGAGTDLLMVCAHFTDVDRARAFAAAIVEARDDGRLDPATLERSRARVELLLSRAPLHQVQLLTEHTFKTHRAAGEIFLAETAEVM
ncbi:beta-N-acetylhexosaminidase [Methylocella sp.]|uniref:beta-N-acetylhexosaminidase n=1 Tax=Methylocella sp. TaxID=1978226 RepID=UPI0037852FDD